MGWPDPTVVISDTPPPVVQCRNAFEENACNEILTILRRGQMPVAFISRVTKTNEIEVHARSCEFRSIGHAVDIMVEAKAKLVNSLFRKKMPARG